MKTKMLLLFGCSIVAVLALYGGNSPKAHRDYVPDETTARKIAEAVLVAQFGQARVDSQQPFMVAVTGEGGSYWLVQGTVRESGSSHLQVGGGFGVWINKHSGCITNVVENMK